MALARRSLPASTPTSRNAVVIVFARAPLPGRVKTRLVPRLGEWGAARLQARLTRQAVRTALAARCGEVQLHVTPRIHAPWKSWGVALESQHGRDLGERMYRALAAALRRYSAALLIGTDCPVLRPQDLRRATRFAPAVRRHRLERKRRLRADRGTAACPGIPMARAAQCLGRRSSRGPRAPQIAPPSFSAAASLSAMAR